MIEPMTPWRDEPARSRAAEAVRQAHAIAPRPMDVASGWDDVLDRATSRGSPPMTLLFAGALSMLIGASATAVALRARQPVVLASAGAQWERRTDGAVQLQQGSLKTARSTTLRVETPQVTLLAYESRFAAEVLREGTRVTVFEGTAVVRGSDGVERTLGPNESALWPAAPVIPQALALRTEPSPGLRCSDAACFETVARGDQLEAEVALFELARLSAHEGASTRAIALWRESLTRFSGGVLEPEVRLSLIVTLTQQRAFSEALAEARSFEATQPEDSRLDEVRALRRQLEWLTTRR